MPHIPGRRTGADVRKLLISGGTGFVGKHLCRVLVNDYEVWGLTRRLPDTTNGHAGVHWLVHDLTSAQWPTAMPSRLDAIVHLAQSDAYQEFPGGAADMFNVNTFGTMRLLDLARRTDVETFVHVSTGGIYGSGLHPFKETDGFHPSDRLRHYLTTKYAAELMVTNFSALFTTVILRPFFIYGTGQATGKLIPRLITRVDRGDPITLHGEEGIRINPIHVSDTVAAITGALDLRQALVANIAGPEVWCLRDMVLTIGRELGRTPVFEVDAINAPLHCVADLAVMTLKLGAPKVRFAEALREICREYAAGPSRR